MLATIAILGVATLMIREHKNAGYYFVVIVYEFTHIVWYGLAAMLVSKGLDHGAIQIMNVTASIVDLVGIVLFPLVVYLLVHRPRQI
jgi:hypothetical protein